MAPFPGERPGWQIRGCVVKRQPSNGEMVGLGRLELPTSRLSSARSNQLSYKPQAQARLSSAKLNTRKALRAARNIRPNAGKTARARPGRKRNEGGEVPHIRPCGRLFQVIR